MARLPRLVLPGYPYHVTQRGNRRQQVFFEGADYVLYRDLLAEAAQRAGAEIWAYCLMPNHVHIIVVPSDEDGLRRTFADAHRRYTGFINARHRWTGHLWQGRFGAVVMDEAHLAHAIRYVSLNPVRARLTERAEDWAWSSVRGITVTRAITPKSTKTEAVGPHTRGDRATPGPWPGSHALSSPASRIT